MGERVCDVRMPGGLNIGVVTELSTAELDWGVGS